MCPPALRMPPPREADVINNGTVDILQRRAVEVHNAAAGVLYPPTSPIPEMGHGYYAVVSTSWIKPPLAMPPPGALVRLFCTVLRARLTKRPR